MTISQKLLRRLALLQTGHPRWIILPAVILAVLSIAYTVSSLSFKTNRKDLISLDPLWSQLAEQARRFRDLAEGNGQAALVDRSMTGFLMVCSRFPGEREKSSSAFTARCW